MNERNELSGFILAAATMGMELGVWIVFFVGLWAQAAPRQGANKRDEPAQWNVFSSLSSPFLFGMKNFV